MNAQDFTYWLQGFAELNSQPPTAEQWQSIREHLATVFCKVTPPVAPKREVCAPINKPAPDHKIERTFQDIIREAERQRKDKQNPAWPGMPPSPYVLDPSKIYC